MTANHVHNSGDQAAIRRRRRDRRARWLAFAGGVAWGLFLGHDLALGADKPARLVSAVQVTAAAPFTFEEQAENHAPVIRSPRRERPETKQRIERVPNDLPTERSPAVLEPDEPTEQSSALPSSSSSSDLSRRAADLGQRMRSRFFTRPGPENTSEEPRSMQVEVPPAESIPTHSEPAEAPSQASGFPWPAIERREPNPKEKAPAMRSVLKEATPAAPAPVSEPEIEEPESQEPVDRAPISLPTKVAPLTQPANRPALVIDGRPRRKVAPAELPGPSSTTSETPARSLDMPGSWVLKVHGTHRIRVPHSVVGVRVNNPATCEVLQVSAHEIVVVGKSAGLATVHLELDSGGPEQVYAFRVSRQAEAIGPTEETLTQLRSLLAEKFPGRDIDLQWSRESLVVSGIAGDRYEAIQIVTFVRDTYLVPVVDRLEVPRGRPGGQRQ